MRLHLLVWVLLGTRDGKLSAPYDPFRGQTHDHFIAWYFAMMLKTVPARRASNVDHCQVPRSCRSFVRDRQEDLAAGLARTICLVSRLAGVAFETLAFRR